MKACSEEQVFCVSGNLIFKLPADLLINELRILEFSLNEIIFPNKKISFAVESINTKA